MGSDNGNFPSTRREAIGTSNRCCSELFIQYLKLHCPYLCNATWIKTSLSYKFQILGLIFGAVTWFRNLIIGENAPLRVVHDSIELLGYVELSNLSSHSTSNPRHALATFNYSILTLNERWQFRRDGTIPCIVLILGGNLTQGMFFFLIVNKYNVDMY